MNDFLRLPPTERACGQVGHLKRLCPNVRRYKLLILNYLQMFKKVSVSRNKSTKGFPKFNNFRQPHLPQTHVDGSVFLSDELSVGENVTILKVVPSRKKTIYVQQNQILKVARCCKKLSTGNKIKF